MKEYSYKNIKRFDEFGIEFNDGFILNFIECRKNWANSRKINYDDTVCVADRYHSSKKSFFIFYSNERVKVVFKKSFFPLDNKYRKRFLYIQIGLNRYGYSSYDCT